MLREFLIVFTQLTVLAVAIATGLWLIGVPLVWVVGIVGVAWVIATLLWLYMASRPF